MTTAGKIYTFPLACNAYVIQASDYGEAAFSASATPINSTQFKIWANETSSAKPFQTNGGGYAIILGKIN